MGEVATTGWAGENKRDKRERKEAFKNDPTAEVPAVIHAAQRPAQSAHKLKCSVSINLMPL